MNTKHFQFTLALTAFLFINAFAQSNFVKIDAADKYYANKDYANAALLYAQVVNDTSIIASRVLPYKIQMVNLSIMPKDAKKADAVKKENISSDPKDSTNKKPAEVVKDVPVKPDSTKKAPKEPDPKTVSKYDHVLYRLASSYMLNADYNNATLTYKKCVDRNIYPDARYYYAMCLLNVKRPQEALNQLEAYVTSKPANDSLAKIAVKKEAGCYLAMDTVNISREIKVTQLDTNVFNKGNCSFAPSYFSGSNKIMFTSARKGNVVLDPKKEDAEYLCDLYWTELKDSTWSKAVNMGASINTHVHEAASFVNGEESVYFTRWSDLTPNEASIYKSKMMNERFFAALKLSDNVNMAGYKSMQPCLSPDGSKLYFSSNRPGGKGGFDIWYCSIDGTGHAGPAKNLGAPFNTVGDEVTPFIHAVTGSLYFSSNGLPGLGGLDIFKCELNPADSVLAFPLNLKAPINSSKDDSYFVLDRTQGKGFFASDRVECKGGNCYKIFEFLNQPIKFDVSGIVFDAETNAPLADALITIIDPHGGSDPVFIQSDASGNYFAELKGNMDYFMKAQKNKYLGSSASISTKEKTATEHFQQDFLLAAIPKGEIEISGIEYDFNSATLRPASKANLDKVVDLMVLNDNLSINIEANTDSRGNDKYNMKLSQARAQSCVDYLISKGIAQKRLFAKGLGETNPLIKEVDINKMVKKSPEWEAAHQKNRRTALKVVGETDIKIINKGQ